MMENKFHAAHLINDLRRIDALVAEHVMGWIRDKDGNIYRQCGHLESKSGVFDVPVYEPASLPFYSSDIVAAWNVVERLCCEAWKPIINQSHQGETTVEIEFGSEGDHDYRGKFYITKPTAPLAICYAALKAFDI